MNLKRRTKLATLAGALAVTLAALGTPTAANAAVLGSMGGNRTCAAGYVLTIKATSWNTGGGVFAHQHYTKNSVAGGNTSFRSWSTPGVRQNNTGVIKGTPWTVRLNFGAMESSNTSTSCILGPV